MLGLGIDPPVAVGSNKRIELHSKDLSRLEREQFIELPMEIVFRAEIAQDFRYGLLCVQIRVAALACPLDCLFECNL